MRYGDKEKEETPLNTPTIQQINNSTNQHCCRPLQAAGMPLAPNRIGRRFRSTLARFGMVGVCP